MISLGVLIYLLEKCCGNETDDLPKSCPNKDEKGNRNWRNLYDENFRFDFHAFLAENETDIDLESELIWAKQNLIYGGDLQSIFTFSKNVSILERIRQSGNLYLHVYLTKKGILPDPQKENPSLAELYTVHRAKRLILYGKSKSDLSVRPSYWASNWSVELVVSDSSLSAGKLRGRGKEFIDCDPLTSKYRPILYLHNK